jgi:long-chain acyl-CoA synthetase
MKEGMRTLTGAAYLSEPRAEICDRLAPGRTLLDFFGGFADSPAEFVIYDDGYRRWSYSYRRIAGGARCFAARLRDESIVKGQKILFWSENCAEWLAAFWGCLLEGVVIVPVDYRASASVVT